jgi:hypothetical protein
MKTERAILESLDEVLRLKHVREEIMPTIERVSGAGPGKRAWKETNGLPWKVEYKV